MKTFRIAILASGSGSNAEKLFHYFEEHPFIEVALVITNNPQAGVIERCSRLHLACHILETGKLLEQEVRPILTQLRITHIVLAGYLKLIPAWMIAVYPGRMINIHPALLPSFGGKGMYGMHVHEAVVENKEPVTGITIHEVNEAYDEGKILLQKAIPLHYPLMPTEVADKIHALEYQYFPPLVEAWIQVRN